jgi:hypothetical protein
MDTRASGKALMDSSYPSASSSSASCVDVLTSYLLSLFQIQLFILYLCRRLSDSFVANSVGTGASVGGDTGSSPEEVDPYCELSGEKEPCVLIFDGIGVRG